mmetsp:Transcript_7165/g.17743  ORF Transcript_7165/g.17743 Transcript_7165/m.17743 type:complete len:383 (-) Transcript_7165:347-1495(-)
MCTHTHTPPTQQAQSPWAAPGTRRSGPAWVQGASAAGPVHSLPVKTYGLQIATKSQAAPPCIPPRTVRNPRDFTAHAASRLLAPSPSTSRKRHHNNCCCTALMCGPHPCAYTSRVHQHAAPDSLREAAGTASVAGRRVLSCGQRVGLDGNFHRVLGGQRGRRWAGQHGRGGCRLGRGQRRHPVQRVRRVHQVHHAGQQRLLPVPAHPAILRRGRRNGGARGGRLAGRAARHRAHLLGRGHGGGSSVGVRRSDSVGVARCALSHGASASAGGGVGVGGSSALALLIALLLTGWRVGPRGLGLQLPLAVSKLALCAVAAIASQQPVAAQLGLVQLVLRARLGRGGRRAIRVELRRAWLRLPLHLLRRTAQRGTGAGGGGGQQRL